MKSTAGGESYDEATGEVLGGSWTRHKAKRTPEEVAEARKRRQEAAECRKAEVAAMRTLDPACEAGGDPPVRWVAPRRLPTGARPDGLLLDRARVSGRGNVGRSRLCVVARRYDGCGPNGGEAKDYVTLFVRYVGGAGYEFRSIGCAVRRDELRDVARALAAHADLLDGDQA
jgi:hypothetical protein